MAKEDWRAARKALQELIDSYMREELSGEERGEWKEMVVVARHLQDLQLEASAYGCVCSLKKNWSLFGTLAPLITNRRIAELFTHLDEFKECLASAQS